MRVLFFLMFLLVGCTTNSVKNDDLTNSVNARFPDTTTQIERGMRYRQDREALNRSVRVGQSIQTSLRNYGPK
jgi:hypothetical protein